MTSNVANHPAFNGEVIKLPPALLKTSVPPPKPVAQHGLLIQAVASQKPVINAAGTKVNNLVLQKASSHDSTSPDDVTSPGEFVAKGTTDLFGNKNLVAEFDIWHGAPPPGVIVGSMAPSIQRAIIKGSLTLSQLVPTLGETLKGADLTFQNIYIFHQNYAYDPTQSLGYNLDADLVIDSSLGPLSFILSKFLGINDGTVRVQADLGPNLSWNNPLTIKSLMVEGTFIGKTWVAAPGVHITSIRVRLVFRHDSNKAVARDMELFGTLNLTLPGGSVLPMELDYMLKDVDGEVQLNAALPSGVTWVNPMGAQGCVLNPVTFSSSLSTSEPWKDLKLDMEARFQYLTTSVDFKGSYNPGGAFSFNTNIQNFDLSSLQQLYEALHHESLKIPSIDLTIESADICISSDKGLYLTLTNVCIAGHASANAILNIISTGSVIHADIGTVQFGDITVHSAHIQLDLRPSSSTKSSEVTIYGDVGFEELEMRATVHLYPSASGAIAKRTEWTVYAELTSSGNTLPLSKLVPELMGTAFDLALKDVLFVAASRDDPVVGVDIKEGYKPKEGVQVYASLDEIPIFNSLTKSNVAGMTLKASWRQAKGFDLDIFLPVARHLDLGNGITTTPVTLSLDMMPCSLDKAVLVPCLRISSGLYIPVARAQPLSFEMTLSAAETEAFITAELKGYWANPFQIGDEVVVGPNLFLQADLSYVTGLSGLVFKGGLAIGDTNALVVVSVNEDPEKEMLYTEIEKLSFADLVKFAEKILHCQFPVPPSDLLELEKLKLHICPTGLMVQDVTYPAGFSFTGDMIVLGKRLDVSCTTGEDMLTITGAVDDFELGPLKLGGMDGGKQIVVQVQVGKGVQHLLIDGSITLYGDTCALHLLVNAQPSPEISFKTVFRLTELVTFEADAKLVGELDWKNLDEADFSFHADLEQHLLGYIHDEVINLLTKAQHAAEEGLESAKKRVSEERTDIETMIDRAKTRLEAARATWEAHQESVTKASLEIMHAHNARIAALQDAICKAEGQFNSALTKAQTDLINAQHDRCVRMQDAAEELRKARRKLASDVWEAEKEVAAAEANMNRKFGAVESDIEDAKRNVEGLKNRMDSLGKNSTQGVEHGSWYRSIEIAGAEIERGGLEVAIQVAEDALDAAEVILKSAEYVTDKAAFDAAQEALDLVGRTGSDLVSGCEEVLAGVDKLTQAVVDGALEALKFVEYGSDKVAFDGAKEGLAAYKLTANIAFNAAAQAMADVAKCTEYLAYESATTALAAAQGSTRGLDAVNGMLSEVEEGTMDLLDISKVLVDAAVGELDITSAHISGTLGKSLRGDALAVDIKGMFMKKPFALDVDLNPRKIENFFIGIFKQFVKASLHI